MTDPQPGTAQPVADVSAQASQWKAATLAYRRQVNALFDQARQVGRDPTVWREALQQIRGWQDNMEEVVSVVITARGMYERGVADTKARYDERWAQVSDADSRQAVRRGPEMEGPRERYARVDGQVFDELRAWRQMEQALSICQEAEREIQLRYRAVNATREDIHQILRSLAFESTLERT